MVRIALVQNQSEMTHYAYADCRVLFRDFGYEVFLYTAQNIDQLPQALSSDRISALVLGSNALNDKTIRSVVYSDHFKIALDAFLAKGGGLLVLLQLRIAQQFAQDDTYGRLSFLPGSNSVCLRARPKSESADKGALIEAIRRQRHSALVYPNEIDIEEVQKRSIAGPSLRGLYWHFIEGLNEGEWDSVLLDSALGESRTLLAISKETERNRIALCALPLDWQRHVELLSNLLIYAAQGTHRTAIFGGHSIQSSATFSYLIQSLRSSGYPFRHYASDEFQHAVRGINGGAHSLVVLAHDIRFDELPQGLKKSISAAQENGTLSVVAFEGGNPAPKVSFAGKDHQFRQQLEELLIRFSEDLQRGYVDGSFFSTIESLQTIQRLDLPAANEIISLSNLFSILKEVDTHERNGSYDEVFHPTCAMLWLRSFCFGVDSTETKRSAAWVRSSLAKHQPREQALGIYSLHLAGCSTQEEAAALIDLLDAQVESQRLTELDLIFFLEVSVVLKQPKRAEQITSQLLRTQDVESGAWIDLSTTAAAVYWILAARSMPDSRKSSNDLPQIFRAISYIHVSRFADTNALGYSFDRKAATSLKCLTALTSFEETLDLPVSQIAALLAIMTRSMANRLITIEALDVVQRLKESHEILASKTQKSEAALARITTELHESQALLRKKEESAAKEISSIRRINEKLSMRTHIEVGVFWFICPMLIFGLLGVLLATLSSYAGHANSNSIWSLTIESVSVWPWWKAWAALFAPILAAIGYFAKERLSAAKREAE